MKALGVLVIEASEYVTNTLIAAKHLGDDVVMINAHMLSLVAYLSATRGHDGMLQYLNEVVSSLGTTRLDNGKEDITKAAARFSVIDGDLTGDAPKKA